MDDGYISIQLVERYDAAALVHALDGLIEQQRSRAQPHGLPRRVSVEPGSGLAFELRRCTELPVLANELGW
jgi:hypothetical protein